MTFGEALELAKEGKKICRKDWLDLYDNVYVYVAAGSKQDRRYLIARMADGTREPWLPSHTDLLADDWTEQTLDGV